MTRSRHINAPRTLWTSKRYQLLRRIYPHRSSLDVAMALGVSKSAVDNKAYALGLKKSAEYLASPAACRLRRGDNVGKKTRFQPGPATWNAGLKGWNSGGRSVATRFKPGCRSGRANAVWKPIGTERVSKDGYLERKIHEGLPMQSRWRAVHLVNWESVNGPLPCGHCLVFKDGNKRNIALGNLELITRAANMRRNTYHRYPKPIALAIQLRGALNRRINRIQNHEEQNGRSAQSSVRAARAAGQRGKSAESR